MAPLGPVKFDKGVTPRGGVTVNLFDHEIFGVDQPQDPHRWVFHYTTLQSATAIASSQTFRLGRMATMNDPREFKAPEPMTMATAAGRGLSSADVDQAIRLLVATRLQVAVASFAEDRADGADGTATRTTGRGYARPALWAHYADLHKGVCLVLDREALERELNANFAADALARTVAYVGAFDPNDWSGILDLDEVARLGVPTAVDQHLRTYLTELLFTKNSDWEPEREWRCCVLDQPSGATVDVHVPRGVVRGIVVGLDLSEPDLAEVQALARVFGIEDSVARTYVHQMNLIDVLPIDRTSATWRYYTLPGLQSIGYA
jgi:hypothetical protein